MVDGTYIGRSTVAKRTFVSYEESRGRYKVHTSSVGRPVYILPGGRKHLLCLRVTEPIADGG